MAKRIFMILVLLTITLSFTSCTNSANSTNNAAANKELYFSYEEYRKLVEDIQELEIEGFEYVDSNQGYIAVDKDISFNKRMYLTIDGEQNNKSTQTRVSYADRDSKRYIYINLIYLNRELENDLVYIESGVPEKLESAEILYKYDESILSFHNILVKMTYFNEVIETPPEDTSTPIKFPVIEASEDVKNLVYE